MTTETDRIVPRRSLLFVPGLRPDRLRKALQAGADCICVDLEDAVAVGQKDEARALALPVFDEPRTDGCEAIVRINGTDSLHGWRDLEAITNLKVGPDAIMLPKVRSPADIHMIEDILQGDKAHIKFHVIIETNVGLENAFAIAGASKRIVSLLFGAVDMSADLRCRRTSTALLYARSRTVHAAAAHGLDVMDVPHINLEDMAGLEEAAAHAAEIGFTGKGCIHPTQLPVVHRHFSPSAAEIARAERAVAAFAETGASGLAVLDGLMLQKPVLRESRRILALAGRDAVA